MKYRIVYFTPDPFRGDKFAVGAMLKDRTGLRFTRAPQLPGVDCLGGRRAWVSLQMAMDSMVALERFDDVEAGYASQLISLSSVAEVPSEVEDGGEWVESVFLARRPPSEAPSQPRPQRERREAYGKRLFEKWNVADYVRRRFDFSTFAPEAASTLPSVKHHPTHWVEGRDVVLLMEPVIGSKGRFDEDLKTVAESVLAQMKLFELGNVVRRPNFVTYVFSNGYRGALKEARHALHHVVDVVDVENATACHSFIKRIRSVAESAPGLFAH